MKHEHEAIIYAVYCLTKLPYGALGWQARLLARLYCSKMGFDDRYIDKEFRWLRNKNYFAHNEHCIDDQVVCSEKCAKIVENFLGAEIMMMMAKLVKSGNAACKVMYNLVEEDVPSDSDFYNWYYGKYVRKYQDDGFYFVFSVIHAYRAIRDGLKGKRLDLRRKTLKKAIKRREELKNPPPKPEPMRVERIVPEYMKHRVISED